MDPIQDVLPGVVWWGHHMRCWKGLPHVRFSLSPGFLFWLEFNRVFWCITASFPPDITDSGQQPYTNWPELLFRYLSWCEEVNTNSSSFAPTYKEHRMIVLSSFACAKLTESSPDALNLFTHFRLRRSVLGRVYLHMVTLGAAQINSC